MSVISKWLRRHLATTDTLHNQVSEAKSHASSKLIDVPHKVLTEEAAKQGARFHKIKSGNKDADREMKKKKVRKKVWEIVSTNFQVNDSEMVDEITERLVEAAEFDPAYDEMFDTKA